jgi:hypothetical protein
MKIIAVVAALLLTGCSVGSATPSATVTEKVPVQPRSTYMDDVPDETPTPDLTAAYLTLLHERDYFRDVPDKTLIKTGKQVCRLLNAGGTVEMVVAAVLQSDIPNDEGARLAGAAIGAFCPQYKEDLK